MKKALALLIVIISLFNSSFAAYVIVYNNDGTKKYSSDDNGRRYYYDDDDHTRNCYYYDYNGNKVYYDNNISCNNYDYNNNGINGDYFYQWANNNPANKVTNLTYKFSHFPADISKVVYNSDYFPSINYKGYTDADPRYITDNDIDDVKQFISNNGYFKFFRFSYYRDSALENIRDNNLDLVYLQKQRLSYPIVGVYVKESLLLFIYKDNLTKRDKDLIGRSYKGTDFNITKYNNWYVVNTSTDRSAGFTYPTSKYFDTFKKAMRNYNVLTFQVGQNPFNNYTIQNFGDDLLQIEILRNDLIYGFVLSQKRTYQPTPVSNSTTYGKTYSQDDLFIDDINAVYDNVYNYYRTMGGLPTSLGSMNPTYFDITTFNPYNYTVKYYTTSTTCFKIGFKPKDASFKSTHASSINKDGYWMNSFCVK